MNEMIVSKTSWKRWDELREFFAKRPDLLINCGLFREGNEGIDYIFRYVGNLHIVHINFSALNGRPVRPFLKAYAASHNS